MGVRAVEAKDARACLDQFYNRLGIRRRRSKSGDDLGPIGEMAGAQKRFGHSLWAFSGPTIAKLRTNASGFPSDASRPYVLARSGVRPRPSGDATQLGKRLAPIQSELGRRTLGLSGCHAQADALSPQLGVNEGDRVVARLDLDTMPRRASQGRAIEQDPRSGCRVEIQPRRSFPFGWRNLSRSGCLGVLIVVRFCATS